MPDGTKLGEAKLRGVQSSGMILAEDEVGIGEDHDGIMVLDDDADRGRAAGRRAADRRRGARARDQPQPPRPAGRLRRRARACTRSPARRWRPTPPTRTPSRSGSDQAERPRDVEIDPEICLRFTARVFEDVKIGPSPLWLKQRLMAAGQRPISNVVDITNYVMLADRPAAARVRPRRGARQPDRRAARAAEGETMTTLDDVERTLDPDDRRWSATPRARRASPGSWAARSPRSPTRPRAC